MMDILYSIVGFFSTGGIFMYPILVVFAFGVAVAVERYITLTQITTKNQSVWESIQPMLNRGDFDKAPRSYRHGPAWAGPGWLWYFFR